MTSNDKLYQLIKSLNKGEKQHFLRYVASETSGAASINQVMFEVITKHKCYKDSELERALPKKISSNLSSKKTRLFQKIVTSLVPYHIENNPLDAKVVSLAILYEHGLKSAAIAGVNKAKALALKRCDFQALLKIVAFELQAAREDVETKRKEARTLLLLEEQQQYLEQLDAVIKSKALRTKLDLVLQKDILVRKEKSVETVKVLRQNELLLRPETDLNLIALENLRYCKSMLAKVERDIDSAVAIAKQHLALFYENAVLGQDRRLLKRALCNLLIILVQDNKFSDQVPEVLNRLDQMRGSNDDPDIFKTICYHRLRFHMSRAELKQAKVQVDIIDKNWPLICAHAEVKQQMAFRYNMLSVYFILEDRESINRLIQQITKEYVINEESRNITYAARLLYLPVLYELAADNLVEVIDSTSRTLRKHGEQQLFEKAVFKYFNQLARLVPGDRAGILANCTALEQQLVKYSKEQGSAPALYEMIFWCRGMMQACPILDVYQAEIRGSTTE